MSENKIAYNKLHKEIIDISDAKKRKEDLDKKAKKINEMNEDIALLNLNKKNELYNFTKYSIERKKEELKKIKNNSEVRKYILLESSINDMSEELEKTSEELFLLNQRICDHKLVYLISYPKGTFNYIPNFKCLSCGKNISGSLKVDQMCVNKDFSDELNKEYIGSYKEYMEVLYRNSDLESEGVSLLERYYILQKYLKKSHKNGKVKKLKKDDN